MTFCQADMVFKARLNPDDGRDWLRTGDLGVLYEGELYPTGRLKELIIVRGRNLLPHDIEAPVRTCHAAVRPGGLAAFGIDASTGTEQIGLCIELRPGTEQYAEQVAERACLAVHRAVGFRPGKVVVGPKGLVPKTTSGKVKRLQCRQQLLDGSLTRHRGSTATGHRPLPATRVEPRAYATPANCGRRHQACDCRFTF